MAALTAEAHSIQLPALADVTLAPRDGRTRLVQVNTRPPLIVQRALYLDEQLPDQAWVFLANPAAGLLAGDEHDIHVRLEPGARAHVTTQAATKVFSMRGGSARQSVELVVAAGAVLEYFPGLVIPFRDADFSQQLRLVVAEGATAIIAEIITPGRLAHGERFAYRRCHSSIGVERPGGETLYHEAFSLEPGLRTITGPGQMGEAGVLATLVAVGGGLSSVEALRQVDGALLDEAATATAALPNGDGLVVKLLAEDIMAARDALRRAWTVVRRRTLGADPPIDRRR